MAQAPTYRDVEEARKTQMLADNAKLDQLNTRERVQGEVQSNKNAVLANAIEDYTSRQISGGGPIQTNPGLGNINAPQQGNQEAAQYVMNATNMAQGMNQEQYATAAVDAVKNGDLSPADFMKDPSIPEEYKTMVLGLMQGGPQDQAPVGLGQVR